MKRIVVYQSGTGFTAKYADWIAKDLGCEAKEYKHVNIPYIKKEREVGIKYSKLKKLRNDNYLMK